MSIAIKVPSLPFAAAEARLGHWYKAVDEVVARGEVLVELLIRDEVMPILAPQAGIVERIFFSLGETAAVGAVIAQLKTGLPNLVWDAEQGMLILDSYRAGGVTTSMEYELRQLLRQGEAKLGNGFGSGLALPQVQSPQQDHGYGMGAGAQAGRQFKSNPLLADSSQFAGDFKDPRVTTVPANPEAQQAPQNAPTLGASPQLGPSAPSLKPLG